MSALTDAELADIRADVAEVACDQPCTLYRKGARVPTAQGGNSAAYVALSNPGLLAGMRMPTAGQLTNYQYLVGSKAAWQLHFPYGTDVRENDHASIAGETLEVVKLLQPSSYSTLTNVLAVEIKGGA